MQVLFCMYALTIPSRTITVPARKTFRRNGNPDLFQGGNEGVDIGTYGEVNSGTRKIWR